MRLPIRIRLAAAYCAVFLVMIATLEVAAYAAVRAAIDSVVDHELETRLAGLDDYLTRHIPVYSLAQLREALRQHPSFQPGYLSIRPAGGETLLQGASMTGVAISGYGRTPRVETLEGAGRVLRVLSVRRWIRGQVYDLAMATDLVVPAAVLRRLGLLMLMSLPVVLLAALAASYWISGRAFAPVAGIIAAARSIDSTRLSERIAVPSTGDEIQSLAETMNGMLARIEDGFERVRQFTANASHELRTPLAIIRAAAEVALLRSPGSEPAYREALQRILRESERNSTLLAEMLQLARVDSGADRPALLNVDLAHSVTQACREIAPLADAKSVRLSVEGTGDPVDVLADEAHLRRLWLILLENAVRYTPAGGLVTVATGADTAGRAFCSVSDTGIGIAGEDLPRIFERFYRVDKVRSRREGGSGLGLAIASEIVRLHRAEIEVQSEVGRGSRFRIVFPACTRIKPSHGEVAAALANGDQVGGAFLR